MIVYSWRWQSLIYRISCWTFVDHNWGEGSFPYKHSSSSHFYENKLQPDLGRGYYCSSARDLISLSSPIGGCQSYQSYILQDLYQQKRTLFSFFPAYNLYFHLTIVIASGISIIFSINFKRIEIFILLYTSINTVIHYLL